MGLENPLHIAILLMVLLLVFGAKRLPEMGRGLGDGLRSFKDAMTGNEQPHGLSAAPAATPEPTMTNASIATPVVVPASSTPAE